MGDTFYVEAADGSRVQLTLTGITENYMFTRLYLSNAQLQALLGGTPEWNTVYGLTGCTTEAEYNALRTKLLGCNYVSSVSFTEDITSMFGGLIGSLNYVVVLIIVLRGGAGGGGAVQPDQRQPCRAQKELCHYQGSGLL